MGTPGGELISDIEDCLLAWGADIRHRGLLACTVIPSSARTYDAFINTDLAGMIEELEVRRVVVCGVTTNVCCDTTDRTAFNRSYELWLVKDACVTGNKERHERDVLAFDCLSGKVHSIEDGISVLNANRLESLFSMISLAVLSRVGVSFRVAALHYPAFHSHVSRAVGERIRELRLDYKVC